MTKVLIAAAALGLAVASAQACPYAKDTTASVDRDMTVASIASDSKASQQSTAQEEE